jgi:hypothetical protein
MSRIEGIRERRSTGMIGLGTASTVVEYGIEGNTAAVMLFQ